MKDFLLRAAFVAGLVFAAPILVVLALGVHAAMMWFGLSSNGAWTVVAVQGFCLFVIACVSTF